MTKSQFTKATTGAGCAKSPAAPQPSSGQILTAGSASSLLGSMGLPTLSSHRSILSNIVKRPQCECGLGKTYIHVVGCPMIGVFMPMKPEPPSFKPELILPAGMRPKPEGRKPRQLKPAKPRSYKLVLQFWFSRPVNLQLWKKIKAPRGWRKGLIKNNGQHYRYCGVRFMTSEYKFTLTPEELRDLHTQLILILEGAF